MKFLKSASSFLNMFKSSNGANSTKGMLLNMAKKVMFTKIGFFVVSIIISSILFIVILTTALSYLGYNVELMALVDGSTKNNTSSSSPAGSHQAIVDAALTQLGVRYSYTGSYYCPRDGNDPNCTGEGPGFNCSGLAKWAYQQAGFDISNCQGYQNCGESSQTYIIHSKGNWKTDINDCSAGDLVFFSHSGDWMNTYHVGIYMGNGEMVHANGSEVAVSGYNNSGNFVGCGWPV